MLENLFTNVFGRPKNRSSASGRSDSINNTPGQASNSAQMTGPFSASTPQMPQPPNFNYPAAAPYPPNNDNNPNTSSRPYYPSLPFSQPPPLPGGAYASSSAQPYNYPTGTLASHVSPLDSVPFEARLTINNSTNLVSLDQLFKDIKKAADVVDRADAYLRSSQSDYDFKTEQNLIYQ